MLETMTDLFNAAQAAHGGVAALKAVHANRHSSGAKGNCRGAVDAGPNDTPTIELNRTTDMSNGDPCHAGPADGANSASGDSRAL